MTGLRLMANNTFRSVHVRNFRLYMVGQTVSSVGTWMDAVAQTWLVLSLTNSGVALGITVALQFAPLLVGGLWAGVIVERTDRRRLLLFTQTGAGSIALILAVITFTGVAQLWMVYVLALALGVITALENPARRVFISELVPSHELPNAVSLNSAVFTTGRVIGPALAGLLIASYGTGWCFLANALSYVVGVVAFLRIRSHELQPKEKLIAAPGQIRDGLRYAWSVPEVRTILAMTFIVGMITWNYQITLPLLAERTFDGGAATFGLLFAVLSIGSVIGALLIANRNRASLKLVNAAVIALAFATFAAALAPSLLTEMLVLLPLGMAGVAFVTLSQSVLQLRVRPAMRARVLGLFGIGFLGSTPIGAPIIGLVAEAYGPRTAMALGGVAALLAATIGWRTMTRLSRATTADVSQAAEPATRSVAGCSEGPTTSSSPRSSPSRSWRRRADRPTTRTPATRSASGRSSRPESIPSRSSSPKAPT